MWSHTPNYLLVSYIVHLLWKEGNHCPYYSYWELVGKQNCLDLHALDNELC